MREVRQQCELGVVAYLRLHVPTSCTRAVIKVRTVHLFVVRTRYGTSGISQSAAYCTMCMHVTVWVCMVTDCF